MLRRLLWLSLVGVLAVGGCSSTEPVAEPPNVEGEYAGAWTFTATRPDGVVAFGPVSCPCTFTIVSQRGNVFGGRTTLMEPCGGTIPFSDGRIEVDGRIQFVLPVNLLGAACAVVTQPPLTGTYSAGTISAQRNEVYDCTSTDGFRYNVTVAANMTRS
jgi:hypothetical protein